MFERFARESRDAVVLATQIARRLGADRAEPEHLLLALAAPAMPPGAAGCGLDDRAAGAAPGGLDDRAAETGRRLDERAARALAEAGLDATRIEHAIEQDLVAALVAVGVPASVVESTPVYPGADRPALSLATRHALERALRAAVRDAERHIGTGHLLLGLLDPPAAAVGRVLAALDVEPARLAALAQVELAAGR
jgi:hypothetical protein